MYARIYAKRKITSKKNCAKTHDLIKNFEKKYIFLYLYMTCANLKFKIKKKI